MVLKFRRYVVTIENCIESNRQRGTGVFILYQKKYLSSMAPKTSPTSLIRQKLNAVIEWYDEFTGMDEVRAAQKRVLEDEEKFRKHQEERRYVSSQLHEVQHKLKGIHLELESTVRGDDRYVVLVTQEHKLLKDEKLMAEKFSVAEKAEREAFAALSSSVKLSHEKERAQSERTKYWSVIGSILGTIIGLLGSSINNHSKMNELKSLIKNSTNMQLVDCLNSYLETNEKIIEKYKARMNATEQINYDKLEKIITSTNKKLEEVEVSLKKIEKNSSNSIALSDGKFVVMPIDTVKKENSQVKLLLLCLAALSVLMPIVTRQL